jgi:hypothetical protein
MVGIVVGVGVGVHSGFSTRVGAVVSVGTGGGAAVRSIVVMTIPASPPITTMSSTARMPRIIF